MEELKKIKKMYGEDFMKLCRILFPTILETEGKLYEILTSYFSNNSRMLYEEITKNELEEEFKTFVYSKIDIESPDKKIITEKNPYELLDEVGYNLTECTSEKEIQKLKKYYERDEELCTFNGGRLKRCYVFFAVRKDVEDIKRENFTNPKREDEYGTSVMGIQFDKEGICTVSIKNRYNHSVNNPDATYGNDLDRITPGLTQSFGRLLKNRGLQLNSGNLEQFEIPGYVVANDGRYYKFNMEIDGIYYCPGNVVIQNGEAHKIENPDKKILIDYFILDLENKTVQLYDHDFKDCFVDGLNNIKKIEVEKNKEKRTRIITIQKENEEQPIIIEIDQDNNILKYKNPNLKHLGDKFLCYNHGLIELDMPNATDVGDSFLKFNRGLKKIKMPNVMNVGKAFLVANKELTELNMPKLKEVGGYFVNLNQKLRKLNIPKLKNIGGEFLSANEELTELDMPHIKEHTKRLLKIIKKNKTKLSENTTNKTDIEPEETNMNSEKIILVNESKFRQIYGKARGRIKEVFSKIKSLFNTRSNGKDDKTNDKNIK